MKIISHRGFWLSSDEKNKETSFSRSFDSGFGTETDVRDSGGRLVISHDMPSGGEMLLTDTLNLLKGRDLPLAINIKADGIGWYIKKIMESYSIRDWFTFDMSVPEMLSQLRMGLPVFTRVSEFETPVLYSESSGVWLDSFSDDWWDFSLVEKFIGDGKRVCIVSPELHGRDPEGFWGRLSSSSLVGYSELLLCTDRPEDARRKFGDM